MNRYLTLIWLMGSALTTAVAQVPLESIRRDSLPDVKPIDPIPVVRPRNDVYRSPADPPNMMRATLDNMPIKAPDPTIDYLILPKQSHPYLDPRSAPPRRLPRKR